ncbi:FAD-binding domain-containing protein [Gemmobacter serpentinus]|uniref:FAD-binding domain-containing protein n=1 Tax=Gemmobacter serpentinus TaxID=2652247 RepID=UPI00124DA50E|nr:FAD-binding domain-containing protein [Gemmobacter serpentinus]
MNVLVWLRRDLRIGDHAALALAAQRGRVLPVWLAEPALWRAPSSSARQWAFVAETLTSLRADLAGLGLPLVIRTGDARAQLERLVRAHDISEVITLRGAGTMPGPATAGAAWARAAGLRWTELEAGAEIGPLPERIVPVPGVEPGVLPSARALGLADDPCPHRQAGGWASAQILLEKLGRMQTAPTHPLMAERASSRLSPHLAWGAIAPGELAAVPGMGGRHLRAGLARRAQALSRWEGGGTGSGPADRGVLAAWEAGETGLPFLDACLRYLRATGWLHHRLRAMLAGSALRVFGLEAQAAHDLLGRRFTDFDPALHGVAMEAAAHLPLAQCDAVGQGLRLDPDGTFIRRWLPELAPVPGDHLHRPWRWEGAARLLGRRYPEPLLDPASTLRALREASPPRDPRPRRPVVPVILLEGDAPARPRGSSGQQLQLDL